MPAFERAKYESDRGTIHSIRLQPATLAVAGAQPAGAVDSDIKAKVTKTNREFGLRPRGVTIAITRGEGEETFTETAFIPVLTIAGFATAGFQLNAAIQYGGEAWTVVGRKAEDY